MHRLFADLETLRLCCEYVRCQPARPGLLTRNEAFREPAEKAVRYTPKYQRADGYGITAKQVNLYWVNNFHTAYVLDCFKYDASLRAICGLKET